MAEQRSHEPDLASVKLVVYAMLFTLAVVLVSAWPLWQAYQSWRPKVPPPIFEPQPDPPGQARLQQNPPADMQAYRERIERRLHSAGWVDRQAGVVHIPIERAMTLLLERGLPSAPPTTDEEAASDETPAPDESAVEGEP
ncbi:hypothetical protein [Microbulbifer yueqingensis]|uniref:Uncharacterized protein n=1 Tax=Microbulbifer yueqingensis TaxID=658219 RepID=A0A1G9BC58_9GAMM|nr:hypothetical protein [Microbulbifer yueqingensis]SDK36654.1 hypothetical protein SAMN05216212_2177 [Microbulbifer yueqingensis]